MTFDNIKFFILQVILLCHYQHNSLFYTKLCHKVHAHLSTSAGCWLSLPSLSRKKPFSVLHSRIVTVLRLTVTSVMKISSASGLRLRQYSGPGLVKTWLTRTRGSGSCACAWPFTRGGDEGGSSARAATGVDAAAPPPTYNHIETVKA